MKKALFITILLLNFLLAQFAGASELNLVKGQSYLLNFNEKIQNIYTNEKILNAQILHTIFDDRKQVVISLITDNNTILQIKTENNLYNYEIKSSKYSSKELVEIDVPPLENIDVDIFEGS